MYILFVETLDSLTQVAHIDCLILVDCPWVLMVETLNMIYLFKYAYYLNILMCVVRWRTFISSNDFTIFITKFNVPHVFISLNYIHIQFVIINFFYM